MEERRTAAWVLCIVALIAIFFTVILPKIQVQKTQHISFKGCVVSFYYEDAGLDSDIYRAAQNKLGHCLCSIYAKKPDPQTGNRIIEIYQKYGSHYGSDSLKLYVNVDTIVKHKSKVLDTLIIVD